MCGTELQAGIAPPQITWNTAASQLVNSCSRAGSASNSAVLAKGWSVLQKSPGNNTVCFAQWSLQPPTVLHHYYTIASPHLGSWSIWKQLLFRTTKKAVFFRNQSQVRRQGKKRKRPATREVACHRRKWIRQPTTHERYGLKSSPFTMLAVVAGSTISGDFQHVNVSNLKLWLWACMEGSHESQFPVTMFLGKGIKTMF